MNPITVDQANFAALTINNTVVTLGTNVAQIRSTSDVDLTSVGKLKQISGSCEWVAATGNIVVKYYNAKNSNSVQISGITAGAGATFNMINR